MNINLLQSKIEGMSLKSEILNKNELYIDVDKNSIKETVKKLIIKYNLSFIAEFCIEKNDFNINIILSNRKYGYYVIVTYNTIKDIISLQDFIVQAHLFEREMSDLFGLNIVNGKDIRNLVKHESWPIDIAPLSNKYLYGEKIKEKNEVNSYEFQQFNEVGAFQIPVGPVHAGIIEPGHFRFTVKGESIDNLEIRLMYKHRGIEKLSEAVDANQLSMLFERVSGESSVAYAEAYALLIEKICDYKVSSDIRCVRTILLELERIYNYINDIAGICVDIGYSYPAKRIGFLSETIQQLCERLTGSRFLRNSIIPFGINFNFTSEKIVDLCETCYKVKQRMKKIVEITLNDVSFLDRVEHTGMVEHSIAKELYLTGIVGRSCGIKYDVRYNFPYEEYAVLKSKINIETIGGVFERYKLKYREINDSFDFIDKIAKKNIGEVSKTNKNVRIVENRKAIVSVETVKGELVVYAKTGKNNKFDRIYFKTPSFTNWKGLTYAVLDEIVPDFPLCNKSFNMSYSENDR